MNYSVDIESLHKNFPVDFQVPPLLLDFANWLMNKQAGKVGYFSLQSDRFDDYGYENGSDLHKNFAFFIRDPTGGQIGYWLYNEKATTSPPIGMVGSEGELKILSNTLEEFLQQLAAGITEAPDLDCRQETTKEGGELAEWLGLRGIREPIQKMRDFPNLSHWMDEWWQQQRNWANSDAFHMRIADHLRPFVKPNAKSWETANFDELPVGSQFKMWRCSAVWKPMPRNQIAHLESLFRSVREQRAQRNPERGLWFSSDIRVGSQDGAVLCCNFIDEPVFRSERPVVAKEDYELDLSAFPRSKHWMPEWLAHRRQSL